MAERFPPIAPVKTRGASASHEGPEREHDDQRVTYHADGTAAFALVVRGLGAARSGRHAADTVADAAMDVFHERQAAVLDDLAEVWWTAEHAGSRARSYSTLPLDDRAELRERVARLRADRVPDAIGDQAVLEAEPARLLELPALALRRGADAIDLLIQQRVLYRGEGATAVCALFACGKVAIAHIGDCRVVRIRNETLTSLTRAHTLINEYTSAYPDLTPEQIEDLPKDVVVRVLGGDGDPQMHKVDVIVDDIARGDVFLLLSHGLAESLGDDELRDAVLAHGVTAARQLVERGRAPFAGHNLGNVAAIAVEIL